MGEDFLAPEGSAEREAYWDSVIGEWTTPDGGDCFEYESGAKLCEHPDGSTFVWIVEEYTSWMQHGDGSRETRLSSADRPSGSDWGGGDGGEEIPEDKAKKIAEHAITKALQGTEDHEIPGLGDVYEPSTVESYQRYVYEVGKSIKPREWSDGTKMFYEQNKDAVVFYNPGAAYNEGTVFIPREGGLRYYLRVQNQDRAPSW